MIPAMPRTLRPSLAWLSRVASRIAPVTETLTQASMDDRTVATVRLVLASLALVIICLDPDEGERNLTEVLALYTGYSVLLYALSHRSRSPVWAAITRLTDIGWSLVLTALSNGTNRMLFTAFFLFATLVAAFRWGSSLRLRELLGLVMLLTVIGIGITREAGFDLHHFFRRPTYLLMIGYLMAFWGDSEVIHRRRLALLKDVSALSNPRFGVERTIDLLAERLRAFYAADTCQLLVEDHATGETREYRAERRNGRDRVHAEPTSAELARLVSALPADQVIVCRSRAHGWEWPRRRSAVSCYDVTTTQRIRHGRRPSIALPTESLVTVPFHCRGEAGGRLTLTAHRRLVFDSQEVNFVLQVLGIAMAMIENIRLVDRLASEAAEVERGRIAHDLHDSLIQPYVGLQMGLEGIRRKLDTGTTDVRTEIQRLLSLTDMGITDLRDYVSALSANSEHGESLVASMRRYAEKFTTATGIAVRVEAPAEIPVADRLAAEAFQIMAEGLSNVRRHTSAGRATVTLACREDHLVLRIENETAVGSAPIAFTPRSITERTAALGGRSRIERTEGGDTAVVVEIPL
jgi:signal transduction histidine kinase